MSVAFFFKNTKLKTPQYVSAISKPNILKANSMKSLILIQKLRDWSERLGGLTRHLLGMGKGGTK
jgi:hypothetical protein